MYILQDAAIVVRTQFFLGTAILTCSKTQTIYERTLKSLVHFATNKLIVTYEHLDVDRYIDRFQ